MKKPLKLQDAQIAKFWNDEYELTLIFQPLETEPPIDPPAEPLAIPTGIKLTEVAAEPEPPLEINIPTGIELTEYKI